MVALTGKAISGKYTKVECRQDMTQISALLSGCVMTQIGGVCLPFCHDINER
jgi:hypothetical protein